VAAAVLAVAAAGSGGRRASAPQDAVTTATAGRARLQSGHQPGFRLCTAGELETACSGDDDDVYPYGILFTPTACNGVERGEGEAVPTGSIGTCNTDEGILSP